MFNEDNMEEKNTENNNSYSLAMSLLVELRQGYNRQAKIIYIFLFLFITLLSYIFYDRWLDSQVEESIITTNDVFQDNATDVDNLSTNIHNKINSK